MKLTDAAAIALADKCPGITHANFAECKNLTDVQRWKPSGSSVKTVNFLIVRDATYSGLPGGFRDAPT